MRLGRRAARLIAKVSPAAEDAALAGPALPPVLVAAASCGKGARRRPAFFQEIQCFELRREEPVACALEPAAAPAGAAVAGVSVFERPVNGFEFGEGVRKGRAHCASLARRSISSALYSLPWPIPKHRRQARSQASGLSMF